jgi:drug/metabolite transporter (DMT)-like permease
MRKTTRDPAAVDRASDAPPVAAATTAAPASGARAMQGALFVAASALSFGAMPIFARAAYADGVDARTLLLLRFSIAGALLWGLVALRRAPVPRGRALWTLAAMGGIGYAGQSFSYFTALTLASAGLVALLLYLYPALVAIIARVALRHPLSRLQVFAIGMSLAGSVLTIGRAGDGSPLGIFFAVLAAVIYSVYITVGGRLPRTSAAASAAIVTTSAGLVFAAVGVAAGVRLPATAAGWAGVLGVAVVGTVLAIGFFLAGLERIGGVKASIYSTLEPGFTVLLAAVFLGERVTPLRVAGGALILAAVLLLARAEARRG